MKVEWRLFAGAAAFFTVTGSIYWFVAYEHAGTVMLAACVLAFLMVGVWLLLQSRRHGLRPEDGDAGPEGVAEEIGYFPSSSVWPFLLSCGAVVLAVGFVFSYALVAAGAVLLGVSIVGYCLEASSKP